MSEAQQIQDGEVLEKDPPIQLTVSYDLDKDDRVSRIVFKTEDQRCEATIDPNDPERFLYQYTSKLLTDNKPVVSPKPLSLANCILEAHIHLGVIPPHKFESIDSPNQH